MSQKYGDLCWNWMNLMCVVLRYLVHLVYCLVLTMLSFEL